MDFDDFCGFIVDTKAFVGDGTKAKKKLAEILNLFSDHTIDTQKLVDAAANLIEWQKSISATFSNNIRSARGDSEVCKIVFYYLEWNRSELYSFVRKPEDEASALGLLIELEKLLFGGKTLIGRSERKVRENDENLRTNIIEDENSNDIIGEIEINGIKSPPTNLHSQNAEPKNRANKIFYLGKPSISKSNSTPNYVDFRFQLELNQEMEIDEELQLFAGFKQVRIEVDHENIQLINPLNKSSDQTTDIIYISKNGRVGTWTATEPKNDDGVLFGEVLSNELLFQGAFTGKQSPYLKVSVIVERRHLDASVYPLPNAPRPTPADEVERRKLNLINRVLGILIPLGGNDEAGIPPAEYSATSWLVQW